MATAARLLHNLRLNLKVSGFRPSFYSFSTSVQVANKLTFDAEELNILVCPLSKKSLRYDAEANELISDEIGVAYPIVNGIPNLIPQDGRIIKDKKAEVKQTLDK